MDAAGARRRGASLDQEEHGLRQNPGQDPLVWREPRRIPMTDAATHYRSIWESYWGSLSGAPGEVFWDAAPAAGAALDLPRFQAFADSSLPLLDVGCGNGTQTRFLADHF